MIRTAWIWMLLRVSWILWNKILLRIMSSLTLPNLVFYPCHSHHHPSSSTHHPPGTFHPSHPVYTHHSHHHCHQTSSVCAWMPPSPSPAPPPWWRWWSPSPGPGQEPGTLIPSSLDSLIVTGGQLGRGFYIVLFVFVCLVKGCTLNRGDGRTKDKKTNLAGTDLCKAKLSWE